MVFFAAFFHVLIFALCVGAVVAVALSVLIFIPLTVYNIPYILWLGNEQTMGRYKEKNVKKIFKTTKDATRVYSAWLHHRKPVL
ncbi:hypothetical protein [Caproicibacter sp.]|uniref:hypothetical protein n=1 Tax=Caproicibacter sp. TaxID=2814884 RepID=UPI0039897BB5